MMYFIFGMLATLVIIGIVVGVADYQDLHDKVNNNHDEIQKQWEIIKRFDGMVWEVRSEIHALKTTTPHDDMRGDDGLR